MTRLKELIDKLRSGELDLDAFVATAAAEFVRRHTPTYPETDGNEDERFNVSAVTVNTAVYEGLLTRDEADAVFAAVGPA